jgi:hypothetical protein
MSTVAISQLPAAAAAAGTDEIPIVQGGTTKKVTNSTLFTSPAMGTPNLGTPSAGVLTNCTGLPIVNGTTGTLSAARGGTGVTTSTGTGSVVLSTSPTLVTPIIGVATATTVNKVTITAPATNSTLTVADGKTLTASNSLTFAGTDGKTLTLNNSLTLAGTDATVMTFPSTTASIARIDAAQTFAGNQTFSGAIITGVQSLSGAGAVDIVNIATAFTSTATGNALTLANGAVGQIKTIAYVAEAAGADTGILTPTTRVGYATITFTNVGDSVTLQYFTQGWAVVGVRGATVA